ncbi:MAG: 2-dehydropantoate 2-reductase [Chloroflexi bacterium]|nr:2-dehydropantoate 2-reductase [Chloroflexota bacterium]
MRITIIGSGAMACLFGARLAPHAEVTLLGTWREGIAAIADSGIRIGPHPLRPSPVRNGDERQRGSHAVPDIEEGLATVHVRATTDPREAARADLALVLVKSWQTERAARQAAEVLAPDGIALTLQNGLGNLEKIAAAVGAERALLGVTTMGATLLGPGLVREGGRGPTHIVEHPLLSGFVRLLRSAGFEALQLPTSDLQPLLWGKVVINCGINALTAILRVPNGELPERPDARGLMERAACEAAEVARAKGIALPYPDPAARVREVARATAANRSSMFQDILRGAPTEIDAINGAVVREWEQLGVATPVNEVLWRLVQALITNDTNGRIPRIGG